MQQILTMMIFALFVSIAFPCSSTAEETGAKPRFMGVFKGSYRDSYPQAVVVKRFLITNGAYAVKVPAIGDEDTIQKMSDKVLNDFIQKGSRSCTSHYYVIEEVSTGLNYHPDGSLLLHSDANVVCFNTTTPLKKRK